PGLRCDGALACDFCFAQKALVFNALYFHMLDDVGHGRKSCEQCGKACRHIELHVDQKSRPEAKGKHANQREKLLAAAGNGIGSELPDESSPHSRFSVMSLAAADGRAGFLAR